METIVLKTLHKNPEDRYSSAQELAEDLNRFLSHQPVLARRTPLSQRIRMWGRRHPAMVGSIAVVTAVVLLATAVLGFMMAKHESTLRSKQQETAKQITATLGEKEEALDAANANLGEALNAIDRFLVELSGEGGKAIPQSSPLRGDLIQSAFEIYDNLESANQMTPELERRKLVALTLAYRMPGIIRSAEGDRLRSDALPLSERLLKQNPHDVDVFFARLNLFCSADSHTLGEDAAQAEQRTRAVFEMIKEQVEYHGSAREMFASSAGSRLSALGENRNS